MPAWEAKLRNDGWSVHKFSIAEEIQRIPDAAPLKKIWIAADSKTPLQWEKTNKALSNTLTNGSLQKRLETVLQELEGQPNTILLVNVEALLHPYMRIGSIESQLQANSMCPLSSSTLVSERAQPSLSSWASTRKMAIYRSVHVGG